ncbi:hypothetical protein GFD22_02835 [Bifidobacterium avesanii]|uniref:Uncharacterized protein n=1 Tax=Bifidobacterium avesanii TaxID=1798157 RepID=A0A7K3TFQ9_9BIFI|nr:hypothetical protein [Bifidobacterium avesanii]
MLQQTEAWRRALAAKRGFRGEPDAGDANASVSKDGVGRAGVPRRVGNGGKGGGRGFMPFKATGHKGGISRQG